MKHLKRFFYCLGCMALLAGLLLAHTWWMRPLRINWFYDRVFLQGLLDSPMFMSTLQLLDSTGWSWYSGKLDDFSIAHEERELALAQENFRMFERYEAKDLKGQDRINWLIARHQYEMNAQQARWRWHSYPVNSLFGAQSQLPDFLINIHSVHNEVGAKDYIARMRAFPLAFEQIIEGLKVREAKVLFPPRFAIEKTREQIRQFVAHQPDQHPLVVALTEKMRQLPQGVLAQEQQAILVKQAVRAVEEDIYPSYRRLDEHLSRLLQQPLTNDGVWAMPDGQAYYEFAIAKHTTTKFSADELHRTGLAEVQRIGQQMDAILVKEKLTGKDRGEKIRVLAQRPEQRYPDTDAGRAELLNTYQSIMDEAIQKTRPAFKAWPQAGVKVQRVPVFSEKTSPMGYYQPPSLDGVRPGSFFVNLHKIEDTPKFGMRTLAYHEAIPGHHLQIALQMKLDNLPYFRRATGFTAYIEGWALYAEQLAWELGLQGDPRSNLGRLQAEMFRAVRLVVDTGMHAKRWTREQAIAYMMRETGMQENEVTVEIERYLIDPGQALAYKVGMMKILSLRQWAQDQSGPNFKLADFHDVILSNGSVPLDVLEHVVREWVATQKR
jgi:uncharacterized protein (DUF885 family)